MEVEWLVGAFENGSATITKNNIVLNKTFLNKFENAYSAMLGFNKNNELIIKPLSLDMNEKLKESEYLIAKVTIFPNFARIGNTKCIELISKRLNKDFDKKGTKFETNWSKDQSFLIVKVND